MSQAILKATVCPSCRHGLLQSFAAIAGINIPSIRQSQKSLPDSLSSQRPFSQSQPRTTDRTQEQPAASESDNIKDAAPGANSSALSPPIPWYLQVETPQPPAASYPLAQRQFIPELPSDPPPILSPILQYLSVDAGLDNLSLIDLRHLDPPPALGANLVMMIGTARSVKHLNVSADRFCRWLRSNYKLRPYADGLLGRNELKLKLRRKARRLKLAQSVGNTLEANKDDGITTGWVCVNVGSVEGLGGNLTSESTDFKREMEGAQGIKDAKAIEDGEDDGYIGFGRRSTAPRIVVQMFTEEKRLEMDLEGLWEFRASRRAAKEEKAGAEAETTMPTDRAFGNPFRMRRSHIDFQGDSSPPREGFNVRPL